jgi:hypothetical protein
VSEPIIREVRDVLNRPELRRKLPGINDRIVNAFLTKLEAKAILIVNVPEEFITSAIPMTRCMSISHRCQCNLSREPR